MVKSGVAGIPRHFPRFGYFMGGKVAICTEAQPVYEFPSLAGLKKTLYNTRVMATTSRNVAGWGQIDCS